MEKYKILEHTADAKFQAYGETLEEAFGNAAIAVFDQMVETKNIKPVREVNIEVKGEKDHGQLLYDFIEHLLILIDTENFLLNSFKDIQILDTGETFSLTAVALGDNLESYETYGVVKAMTYNDLNIEKDEGVWKVTFVVDI